jgi:hypothetical protein
MSVVTPLFVPFTRTPAPMTLSPEVAETTPETVLFWAKATESDNTQAMANVSFLIGLIIISFRIMLLSFSQMYEIIFHLRNN